MYYSTWKYIVSLAVKMSVLYSLYTLSDHIIRNTALVESSSTALQIYNQIQGTAVCCLLVNNVE